MDGQLCAIYLIAGVIALRDGNAAVCEYEFVAPETVYSAAETFGTSSMRIASARSSATYRVSCLCMFAFVIGKTSFLCYFCEMVMPV